VTEPERGLLNGQFCGWIECTLYTDRLPQSPRRSLRKYGHHSWAMDEQEQARMSSNVSPNIKEERSVSR
jgi:hypothetical protein